jgi:hypothetical protein
MTSSGSAPPSSGSAGAALVRLGDADTDGDRDRAPAARRAHGLLRADLGPIVSTQGEGRLFDRLAKILDVRQRFLGRLAGEQHRKLLAPVAERPAAALGPGQGGADQAQHLVARGMTVLVVELLEVVDVDHRDRIDVR